MIQFKSLFKSLFKPLQNQRGQINWTAVSPFAVPEVGDIARQAVSATPRSLPGIDQFISQGMASPLLQQILQPALARLQPGEAQAREALTDRFRAAGGLRSGAHGVAAPRLEGELMGKRGDLISQIISQTLAPLLSGQLQQQQNQFLPARTLADILGAVRPTVLSGGGGGGGGFGGFGGGGGMSLSPESEAVRQSSQQRLFGGGGGGMAPAGGARGGQLPSLQNLGQLLSSGGGGGQFQLSQAVDPWEQYEQVFGGSGGYDVFRNPTTGIYESDPGDVSNMGFFDTNNYWEPQQFEPFLGGSLDFGDLGGDLWGY